MSLSDVNLVGSLRWSREADTTICSQSLLPASMRALKALYEYGKTWKSWGTCIVCEATRAQLITAQNMKRKGWVDADISTGLDPG